MIEYIKRKDGLASVNIFFEGAGIESSKESGCAHLLEHLICKLLKNYENEFDLHGIEFNAITSTIHTQYYIRGLDSKIKLFANEFVRIIGNPKFSFSKKEYEEEKNIIIQELRESACNPDLNIILRFYSKYYNSFLSYGAEDSIKKLSYEDFISFFNKHFNKPVMCAVERSSNWEIKEKISFKKHYESPYLLPEYLGDWTLPTIKGGDNRSYLIISDSFQSNFIEHYIISEMIGSGINSPLLIQLREKHQLVYDVLSSLEIVSPFIAHSFFHTASDKNNKDKVWKLFCEVLNKRDWLTEDRFNQIKQKNLAINEIQKRLGKDTELEKLVDPFLYNLKKELKSASYENVKNIANFYKPSNFIIMD